MIRKRQLEQATAHLSEAITYKTISTHQSTAWDFAPFDGFIEFLTRTYPLCHSELEHTRINGYGLVLHMKGMNRDALPLLFLAHYDVVPVEDQAMEAWRYPPFSGTVADGYIWGRGAYDDKSMVIALYETLEGILEKGQQPERDIYVAIGFDEELGGHLGAPRIARFFKDQNLRFECILDEGGMCLEGFFPECHNPIAFVGVGEKGHINLKMTVRGPGGHAAVPPSQTAVNGLVEVLARLAEHPMPPRIAPPIGDLLQTIAPFYKMGKAQIFSRPELAAPLIHRAFSKTPFTAAMVRTTVVPTILECGQTVGALPNAASVIFNCRTLPGDTSEDIIGYLQEFSGKYTLEFEVLLEQVATPLSDYSAKTFDYLATCIEMDFPDTVVVPYLTLGGTDARHYQDLSDAVFRFVPVLTSPAERAGIHGIDERLSITGLGQAIDFLTDFIIDFGTVD